MSPIYYDKNGKQTWYPKSEEKEGINLNHKDEDQREIHTVIASANMKQYQKNGILNEEDVKKGMEKNAEHIGMSYDEFSSLVDLYLKEKEDFNKEVSETDRIS